MLTLNQGHELELHAIQLEKAAVQHRGFPRVAGAYKRAARILRKLLADEAAS